MCVWWLQFWCWVEPNTKIHGLAFSNFVVIWIFCARVYIVNMLTSWLIQEQDYTFKVCIHKSGRLNYSNNNCHNTDRWHLLVQCTMYVLLCWPLVLLCPSSVEYVQWHFLDSQDNQVNQWFTITYAYFNCVNILLVIRSQKVSSFQCNL